MLNSTLAFTHHRLGISHYQRGLQAIQFLRELTHTKHKNARYARVKQQREEEQFGGQVRAQEVVDLLAKFLDKCQRF